MKYNLNNYKNRYVITAATTIFTIAIMTALSIMTTSPAAATTATTTTTSPEAGIELSPQPIYQEQIRDIAVIPINQTHLQITYSGNGTLNLANGTQPIITTSSTSGIGALVDSDFAGNEVLTTEDGSESATARVYELVRFSMQEGNGRGIVMAVFHTNSTGMIASLEGMILAGIIELSPNGTGSVTLWEWQSGIPLPTAITTTPPLEELPPLMDDTASTTTTNATTADTDATAGPAEEEGGG